MLDDSTLLRHYVDSHDEAAFSELVSRRLPLVYSTALRRCSGDTHCAEEIAQIVFTDLARKAERLTRHPSLVGWLHTSTRYAAAAAFRGEQRRRVRETEALVMQENSSPGDRAADWSRLGPAIDAALDQLAESDRQMILLRYFDNQPFAAIGVKFHLSEDTARKRAERALDKLRVVLSRRGIASTSFALGLVLSQQATASVAVPAGLAASIAGSALANVASVAVASTGVLSMLTLANFKVSTVVLAGICVMFAELKLPPEKLEALKEILVSYETDSRLARSRANAAGERNATEEERAALRVSTDEALRSLLGEDGLAGMRAAEKRGSMNNGRVDRGIAADLLDGGGPLKGEQEKQLAGLLEEKILGPARAVGLAEADTSAPLLPSGLTVGETAVIAGMTSAFTQPQRELLAEHFRFEHERHAVEQRIATIQR